MSIFGLIIFILFFIIIIAFVGFSILLNGVMALWYGFVRRFFGGSPMASGGNSQRYDYARSRTRENADNPDAEGKIFSADEGTYVDFEEVK